MKKLTIMLAALGVAAGALPAAANAQPGAQPWQSINQRQRNLDVRIDQGIRSGQLNRREAVRLRSDFQALNNLEYRYRRTGGRLTAWERNDLNRRFDVLSQKVRFERNDRNYRRH